MGEISKDYIRKNVDTIILRTLLESDSYGYDILKEIESKSNGIYVIKQPTLYNSLKRLEKIGYISSYEGEISQGGKRRYYSLTDLGKKVLEKETQEWEFSRSLMSRLLSDKEYDFNSPPPYDPNELRPMTKRNVTVSDNPASTNYNYAYNTANTAIKMDEKAPETTPVQKIQEPVKAEQIKIEDIPPSYMNKQENKNTDIVRSENNTTETGSYMISNLEKKVVTNTFTNTTGYKMLFGDLPEKSEQAVMDKPVEKKADILPYQLSFNGNNGERVDSQVPKKVEKPATDSFTGAPLATSDIKLSSGPVKKVRREVEPLIIKPVKESEVFTNNVQYRPALDDLFKKSEQRENKVNYEFEYGNSFNNLKTKFKTEGFKLRPYSKSNTANYYLSTFIYSNQINRDCVTLMYFVIVLEILSVYFFANHLINQSLNTYLTIASGMILVPISFWIIYAINPGKRIKAKFNFKVSILLSLMIFLDLLIVIMLIGFFPFRADIKDVNTMILPIFIPALFVLNIPLSSLVYSLLYYSKRYHLR